MTQAFPQIKVSQLREIPIPATTAKNKSKHDRLVQLVDIMLALHQQLATAHSAREQLQRQIAATDQQIDALVYDLYHLTPDEIQLVEAATAPPAGQPPNILAPETNPLTI